MKNCRIEWIDFAKGIAILLVIIGHTVSWSGGKWEALVRGGYLFFSHAIFLYLKWNDLKNKKK